MGFFLFSNNKEEDISLKETEQNKSTYNNDKIKNEHTVSNQLNNDSKIMHIQQTLSLYIKNNNEKKSLDNLLRDISKQNLNNIRKINNITSSILYNNYLKELQEKQNLLIKEDKNKKISKIKTEGYLKHIKSNLILKKIMNNLKRNKKLNIIKYNKIFQKKLNIDINDYKDFSEIELEIIPAKDEYGKFINIINQEDRKYFHIYFDDDKKEIQRIYTIKNDKINKIIIKLDYKIKSFKSLFENCKCIESVYFKKCDRNNINPLDSPSSGAPALNYRYVNTVATFFGEAKELIIKSAKPPEHIPPAINIVGSNFFSSLFINLKVSLSPFLIFFYCYRKA